MNGRMLTFVLMKNLTFMLLLALLAACNAQPSSKSVESFPDQALAETLLPNFSAPSRPDSLRVPLYRSADFGRTWQAVITDLPNDLQISFLAEYGSALLIASDNQGLWLSDEQSRQWRAIGTNLPGPKLNALAVAGKEIWVSVYQHGLFYSSDAGTTWTTLNYNLPRENIQSILAESPLLVGTDVGIYRLDHDLQSWTLVSEPVQVLSLERWRDYLIAGTQLGTLRSKDNGTSWQWIHREGALHYTHIAGERLVEMYIHGDLFLSEDGGDTWYRATYGPRERSYVYEVVTFGDYLILSNNYGIHRSEDGGRTWQLIYRTETMAFFDFLIRDGLLYGGTREWDEFRGRE